MPRITCRKIGAADLPGLADLLCEGFPERTRVYWSDGLQRFAAHAEGGGETDLGYLLAAGDAVVGSLLLIRSPERQSNLSSWYVRPAYRAYATMLVTRALRDGAVRHVNISPAAHTLSTIEAQGFTRVGGGCFLGLPALSPSRRKVSIRAVPRGTPVASNRMSAKDARLLADHAAFGCLSLWLEDKDEGQPFVFRKRMLRLGALPCAMLIYCRSLEALERFAGPLGRMLARHGMPLMLAGTGHPLRGMLGRHFPAKLPIYALGAPGTRGSDLSYTEAALFGV